MEPNKTIQTFTDLIVWQKEHLFVVNVYKDTSEFPENEKFGLVSQMRRAAVSVTSNIAEGFGRKSYKEKLQFYYHSSGSLTELKNQILIAKDVGFIPKEKVDQLAQQANEVHKLLNGLISKTKTLINK